MDNDEFGPMTSAVGTNDGHLQQLEEYKKHLEEEKEELVQEFSLKRARFKELFLEKEGELEKQKEAFAKAQTECSLVKDELQRLQDEMGNIKAAVAVSEYTHQDDAEILQRKYTEELSSLQHIMKASIDEASQSSAERYAADRQRLINANEQLENEVHELKQKLSTEREGLLATMAKSIRRVGASATASNSAAENLEDSMKKAQEDVEILRSVVEPLEEEIQCLKDKLRAAGDRCDELEAEREQLTSASPNIQHKLPTVVMEATNVDDKVKELNHYLQAEKSSRSDLEMYVAVLNTQKNVLQEEADKLKKDMGEVCRLLEHEKKQHRDLKMTWQMANDQFLESQRLLMKDMKRMESVLSAEQQRQLAALQKKEQAHPNRANLISDNKPVPVEGAMSPKLLKKSSPRASPVKEPIKVGNELLNVTDLRKAESKTSLCSIKSDDLLGLNSETSTLEAPDNSAMAAGMKRSWSGTHLASIGGGGEHGEDSDTRSLSEFTDGAAEFGIPRLGGVARSPVLDGAWSPYSGGQTGGVASPERAMNIPSLTAAQQKAITDPTPESQETDDLLATAKSQDEPLSMEGKRLVSENEWQMLQYEIQGARERLGTPCTMCSNYEQQLQNIQEKLQQSDEKFNASERLASSTKKLLEQQHQYRDELEESLKNASEDAQKQISNLVNKVYESERFLLEVSQQYQMSQRDLQDQLKQWTSDREGIQRDLIQIQEENDSLMGIHSKHSQALQAEDIHLPDTLEDMQLALLKHQEDIIRAKVAKEHIENTLKSEIMFLRDQLFSEQQEKCRVEEELSADVSKLQEKLAILQSVKSELDRESKVRHDVEIKLRDCELSLKTCQAKSKQLTNALQRQLEDQSKAQNNLETEVIELKVKVQTLQYDMDNSEAVQRDFVKLSQSLQMQLEKLRQAECEVRWQYEEDVEMCNSCRQTFSVTRRKHHCRNCGRIFCNECTAKIVPSGPSLRPSRVCDVCHTMLVKEATPYFSNEPPATPD